MDDAEFNTLAAGIVAELKPDLSGAWVSILDGDLAGGELPIAVDDVLQGAALGGLSITPDLAARVQRVIDDLPAQSDVRARIITRLDRLPRSQGSAA